MVDIRELGEGASREPAPLVPAGDLDPLRHRRVTARPALVEDRAVPTLHGEDHVGIAGQPADDLRRDGTDTLDLGHAAGRAAHEQLKRRMDHDARPDRAASRL